MDVGNKTGSSLRNSPFVFNPDVRRQWPEPILNLVDFSSSQQGWNDFS